MATAAALWSPLCAPADLALQKGHNDVSKSEIASARSVVRPNRSRHLLCHGGKRLCEENQHKDFCSTRDKEMDQLCGQLEELLIRAGAVGPSPFTPRPHLGATEHLSRSSTEGHDARDRTGQQISRGSAALGARLPIWSPAEKHILDMKSHNTGNGRGQDEEWPASLAAQRRRGSPEVDHFFKAGQVCSRGENCSFAHSVRELKPLLVPPFRRKHQMTPSRLSFASPAAQAAVTCPPGATAHSRGTGGVAAARATSAAATAAPAQESRYGKSTLAPSKVQNGVWEAAGSFATKTNDAPNSVDCAGSSSYCAQQELLSDLRRISEATLESLLAAVQEKGTASAVSTSASAALRAAQKQQTSASLRQDGAEPYFFSPLNSHPLQRYQHSRSLRISGSTASPTECTFPCPTPTVREYTLQQRQQAQQLQQLEGVITRLSSVQRSGGQQQATASALKSPLHWQIWDEEKRHVRFFQDIGLQTQQRETPLAYLSTQHQQPASRGAPAAVTLPCCSKKQHERQPCSTAVGTASLPHCEEKSWGENASSTVESVWRGKRHSPLASISETPGAEASENFPVSLAVEGDALCQHLTVGRGVKKSRRGKRGGRKKRGAGHPAGGGGADRQEQVCLEQQQQQHQEDSSGGEQQIGDHSSYVQRPCKNSSGTGGQEHLSLENSNIHEATKSLHQLVGGSAASKSFSEGAQLTCATGERRAPSGGTTAPALVPAGTSGGGDGFSSLANPKKGRISLLGRADEKDFKSKQGAQLLLEALHAYVATAGGNAVRAGDLAVTAPSLLLPASPAVATSMSPLSLLSADTLYRGKRPSADKKNERTAAFLSNEEAKEVVPLHGHIRQLQTPHQILADLLLQGGETEQLLLQCVRDIMRQTPQASSMSELVSALQLLTSSFNKPDPVEAYHLTVGGASDAARNQEENVAASGGLENEGSWRVEREGRRLEENVNFLKDRYSVYPGQDGRNMFSSAFIDSSFNLLEKEKEVFDDRRSASVDLAQGPGAVASILELLTDEEEDTTTGSAMGQQQASTRSSSRCGVATEEASGLLFGGAPSEATSLISQSSVGNDNAATAPTEYISRLFSSRFPVTAATSVCFNPWV